VTVDGVADGLGLTLGLGEGVGAWGTKNRGWIETNPSTVTVTVLAELVRPPTLHPVKGCWLGSAAVAERVAWSPQGTETVPMLRAKR
jgi:hypothetical protein